MLSETFSIQPIIDAAKAGGAILNSYFGQTLETTQKSVAADFRTKADTESETAILTILAKHFPEYNIFSEEAGLLHRGSEFTFVIDPLDGTNNFVLGIPVFTVSIALFQNETIVAGVLYVPILGQTYYAQKGTGAFLDGKTIRVSSASTFGSATVAQNFSYATSAEESGNGFRAVLVHGAKRMITSWCSTFDYCLLASGKIEAVINNKTDVYDFAAGKLIATEAGAKVTDFQGNIFENDNQNEYIASNGTSLHTDLLSLVQSYQPTKS